MHRLHRKAACAFLAMSTAAALVVPVGAATIYFDVSPDQWYYDAVEYGVITGLLSETVGYFYPNNAVNRATLYTILYRAAGSPAVSAVLPQDVPASSWYASAVKWAVSTGLIAQQSDFSANAVVTRADVCLALLQYDRTVGDHHLPDAASGVFTDLQDIPAAQQAAISICRAAGIVSGTTPVTFAPLESVSRAQLLSILQKYFTGHGYSSLAPRNEGQMNLADCTGWTGNVQLDFPLSAVNTVTEELVISLNRRMLQENTPKTTAALGKTIDGNQKHLTNYGSDIYDCFNTETILYNVKNDMAAGTALTGQQSYYGYALQVSGTKKQDTWHQLAESTWKDPWQCTWWAWGRAAQYLQLAHNQSLTALCDGVTNMGNGGDYYRNLSRYFVSSKTTPKANSIISWSGGQYGHVGYVEAVDENGIWVSMADAGHAWRGITYIPRSNNPNNLYPLYWYDNERCNGFNYLDNPI